jgi:hypothetical protein
MIELSLCDLKEIKSILTERIKRKECWMNAERGRDYEEYCKKELIYHQDPNHKKLKLINQQIESIINSI